MVDNLGDDGFESYVNSATNNSSIMQTMPEIVHGECEGALPSTYPGPAALVVEVLIDLDSKDDGHQRHQ